MKMKHIWSVLCKESTINQDDNIISLYGVLEEVKVVLTLVDKSLKLPDKISVPMNYEIVSFWLKNKKEELAKADVEYKLIDPEDKELIKTIQNIEIPTNIKRFRSRMKISGLPITKEGYYTLKIGIREKDGNKFETVSELPLEIKIKLEEKSDIKS